MGLKNLSFLFALYGLLLLACSAFCLWADALGSAGLLSLAGLLVLVFAHFVNRGKYWGFTGFFILLLVIGATFGWYIIMYFRTKVVGFNISKVDPEAWLIMFGGLFMLTTIFLFLAGKNSAKARQELR